MATRRRAAGEEAEQGREAEQELEQELGAEQESEAEPVEVPITDVIDLHSFPPHELADVVRAYLDAAYEKGLREVRLIHGRGIGVQRERVRARLGRDPRVEAFGDAPPEAGGWGATWVRMR